MSGSSATCSASSARGHPLVSLWRFSVFQSNASRLSKHVAIRKGAWFEAMGLTLLTMKIVSGGALAAVFFASSAQAADADPACTPDPFTLEAIVRAATVGIAAWTKQVRCGSRAVLVRSRGWLEILSSCFWQCCSGRQCWSGVSGRRTRRRSSGSSGGSGGAFTSYIYFIIYDQRCDRSECPSRSILFCIIALFYLGFCQLYIFLFVANVSEADAAKWLESVALRLAKDLKCVERHASQFLGPLQTSALLFHALWRSLGLCPLCLDNHAHSSFQQYSHSPDKAPCRRF